MYNKLKTNGFLVLSEAIEIPDNILNNVEQFESKMQAIFQKGEIQDRFQMPLRNCDNHRFESVLNQLRELLKVVLPEHVCSDAVLLKSNANCEVQPCHSDLRPTNELPSLYPLQYSASYNRPQRQSVKKVAQSFWGRRIRCREFPDGVRILDDGTILQIPPNSEELELIAEEKIDILACACLLAIIPDTTLTIWKGATCKNCIEPNGELILPSIISLDVGDILLFTGEQLHAGSAYKKENYRIHVFLDAPNQKHESNQTWRVDKNCAKNSRIVE